MSNNEEQTQDEKLRAAAENMYNSFSVFSNKNAAPFNEYKRIAFIYGAKSEAAREYWQAQQPKVDVEELRSKFHIFFEEIYYGDDDPTSDNLFDFFLRYLQPESDAVEFAFYLITNYGKLWDKKRGRYSYIACNDSGILVNGSQDHYADLCEKFGKSIQEVYAEFKSKS